MNQRILIVGAGPVGLALALSLKQYGIQSTIIEQEMLPHQQSRALGLHARTLEIFDRLQILDEVLTQGQKISHLNFIFNKQKCLSVSFETLQASHPYVISLPQKLTEEILIHKLAEHQLKVNRQTKLLSAKQLGSEIEVVLQNNQDQKETLRFDWLIGCDGAHSQVRKEMGVEFEGYQYKYNYLLADVEMECSVNINEMTAFVDPHGVLFILPIKKGLYRLVAERSEYDLNKPANLAMVDDLMAKRAVGDFKILDVKWLADFKTSHRQALKYRKERMFIAGDAAHIHSPIGGQGLNTGVQDAYNLAWKLAYVCQLGANSKLLSSYSRERIPVGKQVLVETNKLTKVIMTNKGFQLKKSAFFLKIINHLQFVKNMMIHKMSGIAIHYSNSPIIIKSSNFFFRHPFKAGYRFADGILLESQSQKPKRIFEILGFFKHHLFIYFNPKKAQEAINLKDELLKTHSPYLEITLVSSQFCPEAGHYYLDHEKKWKTWGDCSSLTLVRPDGYIGMATSGLKKTQVDGYFKLLFGNA